LIFYLFFKLLKIKLIYAVDEFPWSIIYQKNNRSKLNEVKIWMMFQLFDGLVCMTNTLISYYQTYTRKNCQFFHFPMTVDYQRFDSLHKSLVTSNKIIYCGGEPENYSKDGVVILIEAFSAISNQFPDLKLTLIGRANKSWINKINELSLGHHVELPGYVPSDEIPQLLKNAHVLVLARPSNKQSEGGFPTKLGEYLSTGNPVITTNVGEIDLYLTDNVTVYFAKPNSVEDFSKKLEHVLTHYDEATKIGEAGRFLAATTFNYKTYSNDFLRFLISI